MGLRIEKIGTSGNYATFTRRSYEINEPIDESNLIRKIIPKLFSVIEKQITPTIRDNEYSEAGIGTIIFHSFKTKVRRTYAFRQHNGHRGRFLFPKY